VTVGALWTDVVGQHAATSLLRASARNPVHAYLFVGPAGTGKRAAARSFAAALLCPDGGCGHCRDCRLALSGDHPDLHEVERVGAAINIEQAREIIRVAMMAPVEGRRKVLVLDEFHLLAPMAASALLKTIEEPGPSSVFCVLADEVPPELVTIASRCVRVEFHPIPDQLVAEVLIEAGAERDQAMAAARAAAGNLDRARLLVTDPALAARRDAFARVPLRLDGAGATVAAIVDELLGLIEAAAEPLAIRQAAEVAELEARVGQVGERGSGRKVLEERHKRELRRHRTDELRAGLAALAGTYRDALAGGASRHPAEVIAALDALSTSFEALERNPNEPLLLQHLLLRLPAV
jgi:DNA polymerase-3 subunit delta'